MGIWEEIKENVGTIVGAVVGFYFGGFQGALTGASVGAAIDGKRAADQADRDYKNAASRLAKAAARQASILNARFTGSNQAIPFAYGYNYVHPDYVSAHTTEDRYDEKKFWTRGTDTILGDHLVWSDVSLPGGYKYKRVTKVNNDWEYGLQMVRVLCKAPIFTVNNYEINGLVDGGKIVKHNPRNFLSIAVDTLGEGVSGVPGQVFGVTDGGDNAPYKFTVPNSNPLFPYVVKGKGLVHTAEYYKKGNGGLPRNFAGGIPQPSFFITGRTVRNIVKEGSGDKTVYKLTRERQSDKMHNTALILLDYLLDVHGCDFSADEIDLESFYEGMNICDKIVEPFLQYTADYEDNPDSNTGLSGFSGKVNPSYYARVAENGVVTVRYKLRKHEFHAVLDTDDTRRNNIKNILASIPGGFLIPRDGKLHLFIPDEDKTTEEHVVDTITDSDLQRHITFSGQDTDGRANTYNLTYRNAAQNLSEATVTYTNTAYLDDDNNFLLENDDRVIGAHLPEAAVYVAGARLSQRRGDLYNMVVHPYKILLQEGDVVKVTSERQGLDKVLIITGKNASPTQIALTAEEFDIDNFTYQIQKDNHSVIDVTTEDLEARLPLTDK